MEEAEVSSEAVAEYLPRIERFARIFNGHGGAEYDDLRQEGLLKVFLLLRDGDPVTNTAIKNVMRNWVRFCYRKGFAETLPEAEIDTVATSAPGRRVTSWESEDGSNRGGATALGYVPETV